IKNKTTDHQIDSAGGGPDKKKKQEMPKKNPLRAIIKIWSIRFLLIVTSKRYTLSVIEKVSHRAAQRSAAQPQLRSGCRLQRQVGRLMWVLTTGLYTLQSSSIRVHSQREVFLSPDITSNWPVGSQNPAIVRENPPHGYQMPAKKATRRASGQL
ncbi:MAG: hypothetical protein RML36_17380, partial [Anaerolineae bacterium]|nr:hypothetical protein [Anaerolineae bacterium]